MLDLKEEYYEDGIFREIEDALEDAGFDVRRFSDAGIMTRNLGWEVTHPDSGEEVQLSCLGTYLDESLLLNEITRRRTVEDDVDIDIEYATLLSFEEAEQVDRSYLRYENKKYKHKKDWWLRSPGTAASLYPEFIHYPTAAVVTHLGYPSETGDNVKIDFYLVRPVLKISNLKSSNLGIGEEIEINGYTFTIVLPNYALLNGDIGTHCFNENYDAGNDYETSAIKKYVDNWFNTEIKPYINDVELVDESYLRENDTTIEDRIEELKMMHNIMRHMNNEDAYMDWIVYGVPDGAYEDDYKYIAEDNDEYNEIKDWFYKVYKNYHDDGLYRPTAEQEEFAHKLDAKLGILDNILVFKGH